MKTLSDATVAAFLIFIAYTAIMGSVFEALGYMALSLSLRWLWDNRRENIFALSRNR